MGTGAEEAEEYDYIIVGAGTAGCVLAERLSASGEARVLLIEAGRSSKDPWLHIPAGYYQHAYGPKFNWTYKTEPVEQLGGRSITWPRGKVLGGSSAINGLVYIRGQRQDFDHWAQLGNRGWSFDEVLPYFKRSEDFEGEAGTLHGKGGRLPVRNMRMRHPLYDAFLEAGVQCGFSANSDFNGPTQEGVGAYHLNVGRWFRASSSNAFLTPDVRRRGNLRLMTECLVHRITFEGRRATGVRLSREGRETTVAARREVIVAAGAIASPQLLQLSGIGPAGLLAEHGVPVVADSPEVGENLQDHVSCRMVMRVQGLTTINEVFHNPARRLMAGLQYLIFQRGLLTMAGGPVGLFTKSDPRAATADLQYHFFALSQEMAGAPPHRYPGCMIYCVPCRPESRGWLRIRSADPRDPPRIQPNYLATENDRTTLVRGLKIARKLMAAPALARHIQCEALPGPDVQSDDEWLGYVRERAGSGAHPASSCRMGVDPGSVVDDELKVRGVGGLRVVDASIMPVLVSGNTNAATFMIAEKGAEFVLRDARAATAA